MNWTAEFARHSKAKKALKKKKVESVVKNVKNEAEQEDVKKQQQISKLSRAISSAVQTEGMTKVLFLYRVCHGFRLINQDDYFRVNIDHF